MTDERPRNTLTSLRYLPREIRRLRWNNGWSQTDLATRADLSENTISRIELGRVKPMPGTCKRIADALGVQVSDITVEDEAEEGVTGATGQVAV